MYPSFFMASAIAFFLSAAMPAPASANTAEVGLRLKNCKSINTIMTRIACYDSVVQDFNLDTLEQVPIQSGSTGKWSVQREKSAIDDSTNVFVNVLANDFLLNGANTTKYTRPSLVLRCREGLIDGYMVWDFKLGSDDTIAVTTRFDKSQAISEYWNISSDKTAAFIPDADRFGQRVAQSNTLLVEAVPRTRGAVSVTFDLRGGGEALKAVYSACIADQEAQQEPLQ